MKKLFCLFAHALLLILLLSVPSHAGTIFIDPALSTVNVGQFFDVKVNVTDVSDLFAYQFDLAFNPAVISATAVSEGSFLTGGGATFFIPGTIDNTAGTITYTADSLLSLVPGVTGDGTLASVTFKAIAPGTSDLTLSNLLFQDSSLNDISGISPTNGSVEVSGAVPEPSTILLLVGGLIGLAAVARGRQ